MNTLPDKGMSTILESSFSHEGRNLTVRAIRRNAEFVVKVFEGDRRVGSATYHVAIEAGLEAQVNGYDPRGLHGLMALAETDIVQGITMLVSPYSH